MQTVKRENRSGAREEHEIDQSASMLRTCTYTMFNNIISSHTQQDRVLGIPIMHANGHVFDMLGLNTTQTHFSPVSECVNN